MQTFEDAFCKAEAKSLQKKVDELSRQNEDLQKANNEYLERARTAEGQLKIALKKLEDDWSWYLMRGLNEQYVHLYQ